MEYADVYTIPAGGSIAIPAPNKTIFGIYPDSGTITIDWDYNGRVATLAVGVPYWEPQTPFNPALTSMLIVTGSAGAKLSIRIEQ